MNPAASFRDILELRGRIVVFTPTAQCGLRYERMAERAHAQVVTTRGWADPYGPLSIWNRICKAGEYGMLSCDQHRYVSGFKIPSTDLVWVGPFGNPLNEPQMWHRFSQAMSRDMDSETPPRQWLLSEASL